MIKIKIGVTLLIVALVCGSVGFWWGKMAAPQNLIREASSPAKSASDSATIAMQSRFTLLQEILVAVKNVQKEVNTLNDRQNAFGQQINTLKEQQMVLFNQYEDLFAHAQQDDGIQPSGADESVEQQDADSAAMAQEAMQKWIDQQQAIQQMPQFQEKRQREKREAMEWTDSLDPDALPSDG